MLHRRYNLNGLTTMLDVAVREIPLTRGMTALVDAADYDSLSVFTWHASKSRRGKFYALSRIYGRRQSPAKMHRIILRALPGQIVDHANGDTLDNRRCNLRLATPSQNSANSRKQRFGSSRFKGVHWCNECRRWLARIHASGRSRYLGKFKDEETAARAYDAAAVVAYGEFAQLNFPPEMPLCK